MAIKNIKERLEGSYRLIRIRRIKTIFFIIQLIIATMLGLLVAFLMDAKFDPLYFPLDSFVFIFLIFILIMSVEAIYFKGMEIKYTRNKSRRYLIARNSIRRSVVIITITALLVLLLFLPHTQEYVVETHSPQGSNLFIDMFDSNRTAFDSQDRFGLVRVDSITITITEPCNISLVKNGIGIWEPTQVDTSFQWSGLGEHASPADEIVIFVSNPSSNPASLGYEVNSEVSPFISLYFQALGLAFIIVQFVAIIIMYPIREAYASSSIYSKKYVAKTESGEYKISSKVLTEKDEEEQALLDSTLDLEMPPPPPPEAKKPVPPPPEDVEMARVKGKVDEDLIEEEDVSCANCGELNSAHSAICFSCGGELLAAEEKAIDPDIYLKKGMNFASSGNYEDAITCYDEVLKHERTHEKTLVQKGLALLKLNKWGSAVQYVNTALKLNPSNIEALLLKAEILESRDRLDKSMEIYSQILAIDPDNSIAQSKMEQVSEEAALESVEDIIEQFMCLPGIGLAKATALYEGGFVSLESLKTASEEDLAHIKGISKGLAKKIKKALEGQ